MNEVDWGRYNLPAILSLISDVDVCDGADRVLAWDGLTSAVRDQHQRLLTAAASLAEVWPPEKNESAGFFMQQVNGLAGSMEETLQKAENTKAGLNGVVQAFGAAQQRVNDLAQGRQAVADDWVPRFVDHAEDKYDEHAQIAMRNAEAAISDHIAQIEAPRLFTMGANLTTTIDPIAPSGHGGSGTTVSHGRGRTALQASPIPVPVHGDESGAAAGPTTHGVGSDNAVPLSPSAGGPTLSSVSPTLPGGAGSHSPGASGAPGLPTGGSPSTGIGLLPYGPQGGGPLLPGTFPIGGSAGLFDELPGRAGSGSRGAAPVRRVMPSGAVIGENMEGVRSDALTAMPLGSPGGRGAGRRRSAQTIGGEADHRWEIERGVAPVIKPEMAKIRHDPGPGVIGLDR